MRWENNRRSSNIEDRRGESQNFGNSSRGSSIISLLPLIKALLGTKIGRVILVIGLVLYFGFRINPLSFIEGEATSQTQTKKVVNQEYEDRQAAFVSAGIAQTVIERTAKKVRVTVVAARPGIIIGKKVQMLKN